AAQPACVAGGTAHLRRPHRRAALAAAALVERPHQHVRLAAAPALRAHQSLPLAGVHAAALCDRTPAVDTLLLPVSVAARRARSGMNAPEYDSCRVRGRRSAAP